MTLDGIPRAFDDALTDALRRHETARRARTTTGDGPRLRVGSEAVGELLSRASDGMTGRHRTGTKDRQRNGKEAARPAGRETARASERLAAMLHPSVSSQVERGECSLMISVKSGGLREGHGRVW